MGLGWACAAPPATAPGAQTVVLISFDGWRWDYLDRSDLDAPNLRALAARGVRSRALIPSFPSKTFPNHYTLVTGLQPGHHGIVGNVMLDDGIGERFTMSSATAKDPRWWGGEPLWVTTRRHGIRSASMFWPGAEVPMAGGQPDQFLPYDDNFPNAARVDQVLEWLDEPEDTRPRFITLYFSDVDTAGHREGPDSEAVAEAAARVDAMLGRLMDGVEARGLERTVTYVVVSDHGMASLSPDRQVVIDDYLDPSRLVIVELDPNLTARPAPGEDAATLVRELAGRHPAMHVYLKEDLPAALAYSSHPRIPPIVALAEDGWVITTRERMRPPDRPAGGTHGYDPRTTSMGALFVAAGAPLERGLVADPIRSIDVYAFVCRLLGITPAPNDGDPAATSAFFR